MLDLHRANGGMDRFVGRMDRFTADAFQVISAYFSSLLSKFKRHERKLGFEHMLTFNDKLRKIESDNIGVATLKELGPREPKQCKAVAEYKVGKRCMEAVHVVHVGRS